MQERQRAAKEQGKQASGKPKPAASKIAKVAPKQQETVTSKPSKIAIESASDITTRPKGGRTVKSQIFSHFGAAKHSHAPIKGDIHPVIVSLGQKFGAFKITGANARCVATMTAFKTVSLRIVIT